LFKETCRHGALAYGFADLGGSMLDRFQALQERVEAAYFAALWRRALAELVSARDGDGLATWATYEDVIRRLREEADDAKDYARERAYRREAQQVFSMINRKVEELFTPEYLARVRPINLLNDPGNWEPAGGTDTVKYQFTDNALVITNEGEDARFGGIFYKAASKWRDYVVELDFKLDAGALTFYTRAEVMDTKHAPGISIGKEKCDVNFTDFGRTKSAVISVIGGRFTVALDGADVKSSEPLSFDFPRKGPFAIAIKPGTALTITRLQVRKLR
jgi:hypothetical protein